MLNYENAATTSSKGRAAKFLSRAPLDERGPHGVPDSWQAQRGNGGPLVRSYSTWVEALVMRPHRCSNHTLPNIPNHAFTGIDDAKNDKYVSSQFS